MKLKELRTKKGIKQNQLALLLEVRQSSISQWERNKTKPSIKHLVMIAEILKTDIETVINCFLK